MTGQKIHTLDTADPKHQIIRLRQTYKYFL